MSDLRRWTGDLDPGPFRFRRSGGEDGEPEVIVYLPDNGRYVGTDDGDDGGRRPAPPDSRLRVVIMDSDDLQEDER